MDHDDWNPIYEAIRADMGYDRAADERARDRLAAFVEPFDLGRLDLRGRTVAVAGGAPSLSADDPRLVEADAVVAASTAADVLLGGDVRVDLMVTDLDKNADTAVALTRAGVPVAVHAHGDNVSAIEATLPRMATANVLGTCQVAPTDGVVDVGGFTDGDRGAFLADHLGAKRLRFPGWDFEDPTVDDEKTAKLGWAERLLALLESRRDERFEILDGRRDRIEPIRP
ncbi:MAG: 6-hydroxymethylpterin diphosphokinase MptE-like protein [Halanaeroarchaeum sp.]